MTDIKQDNLCVFKLMSLFLNLQPDAVSLSDARQIANDYNIDETYAFAQLLASYCCLDITDDQYHKMLFRQYFVPMLHAMKADEYARNRYYTDVKITESVVGDWELKTERLKAGECFVCNDPVKLQSGRILPQIGYFDSDFDFPAVLQGGREWMTLMPNETITTQPALDASHGKVLTYGLGLAYFAYMAALKPEVMSVTVVEKDEDVIKLYRDVIEPQLCCRQKIEVIHADAFDYAEHIMPCKNYDVVFTDIWHDPSDGVELYQKMRGFEHLCSGTEFIYWLKGTLDLYISGDLC